jgi:glycosyltransferase involved in cell wall biosynthesis
MINESGCGTYVPAGDVAALRAEIIRFSELPELERMAMGARGREWILANRNYQALARDYLAILFPGQEQ